MVIHDECPKASRRYCDDLLEALQRQNPSIKRFHAAKSCAFYVEGNTRFAYLYHLLTRQGVDIWCRGELESLQRLGSSFGVEVLTRNSIRGNWAESFPYHFRPNPGLPVDNIASFLIRGTIITRGSKQSKRRYDMRREPYRSPDELPEDRTYTEGACIRILVNRYERDSRARGDCIAAYGFQCSVCQFDFKQYYGDVGKEYIHVHHLISLSELRGEYELNPVRDLRPVCPNCHAMLHRRVPPFTIEELQDIVNRCRNGGA